MIRLPPWWIEMAQTFLKKDGDIREVLKTMLRSPEFWSGEAYRAKVKTPLEFVVSAVRATGARGLRRDAACSTTEQDGHAALRDAAADRLLDEVGRLGELVGAAGPHEFFAGADGRQN